ncbi:MAG: phenylalanine--tRNA ligase subunit beta [Gammaproteobacteria bacterium]|nr:MAG: phenylalanine--tRNA ligase subunit beta [Gammaproteobacteria bacterium]RLA49437.1 MAG: phenylalanine--tRNA ligase subunit beta [Gammaproteobacteria bacterium]
MKFSESWLRETVQFDGDTEDLVARLTMAGLEVDGTEPAAAEFSGVVVAEITNIEAHPEAEKLNICLVDAGERGSLQVVCGAPNARAGLKVAFATVGACLPGGLKVDKANLRGADSFGMLCSAAELGLSEDDAGLLELAENAVAGVNLRECLALDDTIIEVDLTPNRGDCLSIMGLARETAALYKTTAAVDSCLPVKLLTEEVLSVHLSAPEACPRYAGRVVTGIDIRQPSPHWLQEKLRRSGIRSIDAVVDVTNYVMLELGQPMHAFDLDSIKGGIDVRFARPTESLTLLGGTEVDLDADSLVIADQAGALALAGVMGGEGSAVSSSTTNIFLESAHFNPLNIAGKARQYALHTDSSHRFERGVDPQLPVRAIERATELLLEFCGGQPGPTVVTEEQSVLPVRDHVLLRKAKLAQQLQLNTDDILVVDILGSLGIKVIESPADGWLCDIPSWRFDLTIEADLIEEIARMYGYDNLPVAAVNMPLEIEKNDEQVTSLIEIKRLMAARDYLEAITYSFVDEDLQKLVNPGYASVQLTNPISADMGVMRTSLITGLLLALKHNANRQQSRIRLFEVGQRFIAGESLIQEEMIAGVITGNRCNEGWTSADQAVDFYDIKGDIEALLAFTGAASNILFRVEDHPVLQPGQSLVITDNALNTIGYIGKLHPNIEKYLGLKQSVFIFELELDAIHTGQLPEFVEIARFPSVKRDIAVFVDEQVSYEELHNIVMRNSGDHLTDLKVFDVYEGKHVESNRKSIALSLTFQDNSRTLTDEEVKSSMDVVIAALESECSAQLRG